ncbi:S-adenosyl-L-methionine-dependent methyltransferase, partial [Thamnocephalis sphaerospora]
ILDVGTGNGTWLLEMAAEFPDAQLTGIDLVHQAPTSVLPPNCTFKVMDALHGLRFPDASLDYIHHRYVCSVPADRWGAYLADCARVLRPGGWIEVMESD